MGEINYLLKKVDQEIAFSAGKWVDAIIMRIPTWEQTDLLGNISEGDCNENTMLWC